MDGLKKADVTINRKMLSELAINNKAAFIEIVNTAKSKLTTYRSQT
jgi:large subunit ribosomal protein L20